MKRGRPPLPSDAVKSTTVTIRIAPTDYAQAKACAAQRGVSLPAVLRAGLRRWMAAESPALARPRAPFIR